MAESKMSKADAAQEWLKTTESIKECERDIQRKIDDLQRLNERLTQMVTILNAQIVPENPEYCVITESKQGKRVVMVNKDAIRVMQPEFPTERGRGIAA